jgi:transketolase
MSDVTMAVDHKSDIDRLSIDTIRTLSMDAVQKANSGHPGTPMAMAPVAYTLWSRFLRYDPADPLWPNRDRFVLSAGHASMLLYSLLYLAGVDRVDRDGHSLDRPAVSLSDIEQFRQLDSVCPGHPEYGHTTGVEVTTGPLGQGCGNSVGMAIAERWLAARYNAPGYKLFDHCVYALCSDGDMMEGVSGEAASLAGHLKLSNLCWIYDSNTISIEGHTEITFTEDVAARFRAYGWNTLDVADANDCEAVADAIEQFQATDDRPTLIVIHSVIGYGAPHKQNTAAAHGEALGEDEVRLAKRFYGWPEDAKFYVPDGVREHLSTAMTARSRRLNHQWRASFARFAESAPDRAAELRQMRARVAPTGFDRDIPVFPADPKGMASREASLPICRLRPRPTSRAMTTATSSPATTEDVTSTSAYANIRWARSSTA